MDYPYKQYLKYLLTQKKDNADILEDCLRLNFVLPTSEDLLAIKQEIGRFPTSWEPRFNSQNEYFCKWLRKQGVIQYWRRDPDFLEATNFLYRANIRKDFETLSLSHTNVSDVRQILLLKYDQNLIPGESELESYCKYYWNLSEVTREGLVQFLSQYHNRDANLAAIVGDLTTSYAHAELPETVSDEAFFDNFISMVNRQVVIAKRTFVADPMPGNLMMGLAALGRQAQEAIASRKEIKEAGKIEVLNTIKQQALSFQTRTIEGSDIITIDDVLEDESEQEDDLSNVRKLSIVSSK